MDLCVHPCRDRIHACLGSASDEALPSVVLHLRISTRFQPSVGDAFVRFPRAASPDDRGGIALAHGRDTRHQLLGDRPLHVLDPRPLSRMGHLRARLERVVVVDQLRI